MLNLVFWQGFFLQTFEKMSTGKRRAAEVFSEEEEQEEQEVEEQQEEENEVQEVQPIRVKPERTSRRRLQSEYSPNAFYFFEKKKKMNTLSQLFNLLHLFPTPFFVMFVLLFGF